MISEAVTKEFQASSRGQLLTPADGEYDAVPAHVRDGFPKSQQ